MKVPKVVDKPYVPICTEPLVSQYFECKKIIDFKQRIDYYIVYCTEVNGSLSIKKANNNDDECYIQTYNNRRRRQ